MIKFEKVSFNQFKKDWEKIFGKMQETHLQEIYNDIKLPKRATDGSAGYDFFMPWNMLVASDEYSLIPTGIRFVSDQQNVVLMVYPRSGLGFKYAMRLINTVGCIDQDYQFATNEGHIMVKFISEKNFELKQGDAFCQGIISQYLVTTDDDSVIKEKRTGGFGSTTATNNGKKEKSVAAERVMER